LKNKLSSSKHSKRITECGYRFYKSIQINEHWHSTIDLKLLLKISSFTRTISWLQGDESIMKKQIPRSPGSQKMAREPNQTLAKLV